jgi:hypothetical protein
MKFLLAGARGFLPSRVGRVFHVKSRIFLRFDFFTSRRLYTMFYNT